MASLLLRLVHFIYQFVLFCRTFCESICAKPPLPLDASRSRLPRHLAVVFTVNTDLDHDVVQESLIANVSNIIDWCRSLGIQKLTVYEEHGRLVQLVPALRQLYQGCASEPSSSESEIEYPLTPPPSDYSDSRPISPEPTHATLVPTIILKLRHNHHAVSRKHSKQVKLQRRKSSQRDTSGQPHDLTLCVASRTSSKPAIAAVARSLARAHRASGRNTPHTASPPFSLTVNSLEQLLEDESGLSPPDFMILHALTRSVQLTQPTELHAFPPWHVRLTEICDTQTLPRTPRSSRGEDTLPRLEQASFLRALDAFASAEMRFGK